MTVSASNITFLYFLEDHTPSIPVNQVCHIALLTTSLLMVKLKDPNVSIAAINTAFSFKKI